MKRTAFKIKPTIIYLATNRVDGKRYIGITCRTLADRRAKHIWSALCDDSQTYFHRAIRKHGKDNFEFTILECCASYCDATSREIALIAELKPEYNQTLGGDGYLGWSPSEEQRRRLSERLRGKPGPWAGKELAPTFIAAATRWRTSDEGKTSWAQCAKLGPLSRAKKVVCLDDGMVFEHARLAGEHYGINPATINCVCRRDPKRKTAGGLVFRFFGDHHGSIDEANRERHARLLNRQRTAAIARSHVGVSP